MPMIIELEGIDGVGKTSQCRLLRNWLEEQTGARTLVLKDLESTQLGRKIKEILTTDVPCSKQAELFAFLSCKAHLFSEVIDREVAAGSHIICDRGYGSFLSYFEVYGFDRSFLESLLKAAVPASYKPHTILLDADVQTALRRNIAKSEHSRFDALGSDFFSQQRHIYLELAKAHAWMVVKCENSIDAVHQQIVAAVSTLLND